jgi:hypothetical protein
LSSSSPFLDAIIQHSELNKCSHYRLLNECTFWNGHECCYSVPNIYNLFEAFFWLVDLCVSSN